MLTAIQQFISVKTDNLSLRRKAALTAIVAVFLFVLPLTGVFLYTRGGASAAASSTLNFQGRLLTSSGQTVSDGSYNIQFNLYTVPTAGTTQWTETYAVSASQGVTVKNGYFSVSLGSITGFPTTIAWDQEQWLGMTVQGTSSCTFGVNCAPLDAEMTPRFKLTAVPFAFRAAKLMDGTNTNAFTADDLIQKAPSTAQVVSSALAAIRLNQTSTGGLLQLQNSGTDVFTVANTGNTTTSGTLTVTGGTATLGSISQAGNLVLSDGTSNTTTLQAGSTASNLTFTLPSSYGNNGDCLTGNGAGVLTFAATCGGTLSVNPTANVRKSADETQNNVVNPTAVLQNDDELFFAIGANETWSFRFVVQATNNATPDIKFAVTAPAGATCVVGLAEAENALSNANIGCGVSLGAVPATTATDAFEIFGTVVNGVTAGNVTLQWAQNTANVANTIVRAGSHLNADRIAGPGQTAQAFIQNGNSFNALAILGTNDNNALSVRTNGIERLRILATGEITAADDIIAQGAATGTTGTSAGVGATNTTTITLAAAGAFANNDVIFVDNTGGSGQDYYTRIVSGGGTTTLTVSPAVSYGSAAGYTGNATITKYTTQNIGATTTDYTSQANRFFQGYFLGGITVGTNSTTLSDGLLSRTVGDIVVEPGTGGAVQVNGTLNATTINATTITGDGSSITNINGASITGGSIADSSLSSNVALLNTAQSFTALQTFGAGLTISASQALALNGDSITDLTGTGLVMNAGSLETTLGTSVDLASEVTGTLTITNGGTGATTQQDAINALSGLTTNGDLLYYDGTNSTRLARGSNGQCLTSNGTTILWGSCTTGAVTSVGTLDSQTKSADGAVIASGALVLQTADATNAGLVSTGVQTFAGDKTFNGQIIGTAGLSVDGGTVSLNVTGTTGTSIGNATGTLSLVGNASSTISINGITLDATELSRLDGKDAALVDANDAVATAITGTGALTSGSIGGSFGNINIGTNTFTGNGSGLTTLNASNISSGTVGNAFLTNSGALTVTAGTGLSGGGSVALGGTTTLNVAYGSVAGTAVQGDTTLTCASGTGNLSGGGNTITLGAGGTCGAITISNTPTFSGLITGQAGATISGGAVSINTTGTSATSIGNSGASLSLVGDNASTIAVNGITLDATELSLLDGKDAALVDINDAVATAITGTGALTSGSIGGSFGNINIGTNTFTGNGSGLTSLNGTNISAGTISNSVLTNSGALTVTAGTGLGGGGSVALGSSISLNVAYGSTAGTAVQGDITLVCPSGTGNLTGGGTSITLGTGGTCGAISTNNAVTFSTSVTTPSIVSAGALSLASGGAGDITINSASNVINIDGTDTTIRRTAAGNTNIELNDTAATTLTLNNTGVGAASFNLSDGALQTAGTVRLSNGGALQNITGLTITSGGASVTGASTFANDASFNGNITIGDATTDRLTITSQILGGNPLVFQGATDNAFTTTFSLVDPTANNTITVPNASGTVTLIAPAVAQIDSSTNSSLFINKTGATGNILTLQKNAAGVFTIGNDGSTTIATTSTTAFVVDNAGGTDQFSVDSSGSIVRVGAAVADGTATVLVTDSKNTTGDPAGGAATNGAQYYNSFWQQFRCYRDGAWETCGVNPIDRAFVFNDEFISGYTGAGCTTATAIIGDQNWTCFTSGTANTAYNTGTILPTADRPGIIRMTTAAANGNGFTMALAGNNSGSVVIAPQNRVKAAAGLGTTITNNRLRVGLHAQTTTNVRPTTGVWWEADPTTNANWNYCYGTGAVATCASSGVAVVANTLYSLDILVTATGAGTSAATFKINGTAFNVTNVTISTAARVNPAISCFNSAAAARECFVDYYQFTGVAAARR